MTAPEHTPAAIQDKKLVIPAEILESTTPPPFTGETLLAWTFHQAGLERSYGVLVGGSGDRIQRFLSMQPVQTKLEEFFAAREAVFLGPSATVFEGRLTVHLTDKITDSLGIWVARAGWEVHPEVLPEEIQTRQIHPPTK